MGLNSNEQGKTGETEKSAKGQNKDRYALALSGGGFRASFFHIGVLAALADLGILHKIEVLSCVSGGSIIGALYYLKVKNKLELKRDPGDLPPPENCLTTQDYIEIVQDLEKSFLLGVEKNIRMRVISNIEKNARMGFSRSYSRSNRIAELYDKYFYGAKKTRLRDLKIFPPGYKDEFDPENDNVDREFKVPILKINATTLNTGHNWSFEAKHMGEPPRDFVLDREVDKNMRLRRPPDWGQTTPEQSNFRLGHAVAASACVPGLFHPLAIRKMYDEFLFKDKPENITAQLVDGGVHDNLGIDAIPDYCNRILISDASGQMEDDPNPSTNIISVLTRSNSIMMDRIREEELFKLREQCKVDSNKKFALMHLRAGLPRKEIKYLDQCLQPGSFKTSSTEHKKVSEDFGVPQIVQDLLSRIRTDLDSFTEIEAYSLMYDSYSMSNYKLTKEPIGEEEYKLIEEPKGQNGGQWKFIKIEPLFDKPTEGFLRHLRIGAKLPLKVFYLRPYLSVGILVLIYGLIFFLLGWLIKEFHLVGKLSQYIRQLIRDGFDWKILIPVAGIIFGFFSPLSRKLNFLKSLRAPSSYWTHIFTRFAVPSIVALFVWIHLKVFDRIFKNSGRLEKFLKTE